MQLIAEAWHLLKAHLGLSPAEGAQVSAEWNQGPLQSYLVEIICAILINPNLVTLRRQEPLGAHPLRPCLRIMQDKLQQA
jgi:6-phosphogluconate dehydrogenase